MKPPLHAHTIDHAMIDELRRRLVRREQELVEEYLGAERKLETIEDQERLRHSRELDRLAADLDRLEDREKHELREIRHALTRIAQGIYGVCESCRGPIAMATLESNPESRLCSSCAPPPKSDLSPV
jgi:RNA polymerase-binding transcription factor